MSEIEDGWYAFDEISSRVLAGPFDHHPRARGVATSHDVEHAVVASAHFLRDLHERVGVDVDLGILEDDDPEVRADGGGWVSVPDVDRRPRPVVDDVSLAVALRSVKNWHGSPGIGRAFSELDDYSALEGDGPADGGVVRGLGGWAEAVVDGDGTLLGLVPARPGDRPAIDRVPGRRGSR